MLGWRFTNRLMPPEKMSMTSTAIIMKEAERLSRRDQPTQVWLIQYQLRREDLPAAMRQMDIALRTASSGSVTLFGWLAIASEDERIARGIRRFEGGAQGEHKVARGFLPQATWSAHWLAHPAFASAVERFLQQERGGIAAYMSDLNQHTPFQPGMQPKNF